MAWGTSPATSDKVQRFKQRMAAEITNFQQNGVPSTVDVVNLAQEHGLSEQQFNQASIELTKELSPDGTFTPNMTLGPNIRKLADKALPYAKLADTSGKVGNAIGIAGATYMGTTLLAPYLGLGSAGVGGAIGAAGQYTTGGIAGGGTGGGTGSSGGGSTIKIGGYDTGMTLMDLIGIGGGIYSSNKQVQAGTNASNAMLNASNEAQAYSRKTATDAAGRIRTTATRGAATIRGESALASDRLKAAISGAQSGLQRTQSANEEQTNATVESAIQALATARGTSVEQIKQALGLYSAGVTEAASSGANALTQAGASITQDITDSTEARAQKILAAFNNNADELRAVFGEQADAIIAAATKGSSSILEAGERVAGVPLAARDKAIGDYQRLVEGVLTPQATGTVNRELDAAQKLNTGRLDEDTARQAAQVEAYWTARGAPGKGRAEAMRIRQTAQGQAADLNVNYALQKKTAREGAQGELMGALGNLEQIGQAGGAAYLDAATQAAMLGYSGAQGAAGMRTSGAQAAAGLRTSGAALSTEMQQRVAELGAQIKLQMAQAGIQLTTDAANRQAEMALGVNRDIAGMGYAGEQEASKLRLGALETNTAARTALQNTLAQLGVGGAQTINQYGLDSAKMQTGLLTDAEANAANIMTGNAAQTGQWSIQTTQTAAALKNAVEQGMWDDVGTLIGSLLQSRTNDKLASLIGSGSSAASTPGASAIDLTQYEQVYDPMTGQYSYRKRTSV